ncbi:protein prenyltransferase alpha subunit repeat-containing protein 1 [Histomonas meleagridis]|uniref:protein prenyltransferase alpha subunit repeat-containing protein 1 n=1 Tax=Histomonas meleagridis TaxID=135588 RepID=UPI00355955D8|nr:protein prenyltransferase alpha subunit repeat-containing protein 1 [Histomonas meleagridis]KAH0796876.1 protein prenyltransferase alpha subunit repeat-containing protein 1 [Histomonas meleagridis]
MEIIDDFINKCKGIKTIDIVGDMFIPGKANIYISDQQLAISKSLYKKILKYTTENISTDPIRCSHAGALIGSFDDRIWITRLKNKYLPLREEIQLCHLGLTANPKSPSAFENIRFLLRDCHDPEIIQEELKFCEVLTTRRTRNALLWRHRVWCCKTFHTEDQDLSWAKKWVESHPSDCSAFYFLEHLMPTDRESLISALADNTSSIFSLPGHESIWFHRRFILQKLIPYLNLPNEWKPLSSPTEEIEFPLCKGERRIRYGYQKICNEFKISISMVFQQTNDENNEINIDLRNEDLIIALARGDNYPVEYEKQKDSAEKHYKWLRFIFMKMFTSAFSIQTDIVKISDIY